MRATCGHIRSATGGAVALFAAAVIAACGSSTSVSSPTARPATATPESSTTPITTTDPGDPTLLPVPSNIPFLQAPQAIQNEWRTYYATGAITVVPNSTVPFQRPATPQVVDATNGAVSSTTAQQWGDALMRETAWENWAITANQLSLLDNGIVSAPQAEPGLVLPQGASGFRIVGPRWPSSLRLVPLSSSSQTFLGTTDGYAFVFNFKQPWSVQAVFPNGTAQAITDQSAAVGTSVFVAGKVTTATDFGQLWYGSASFVCNASEPAPVLTICAE